MKTVKYIQHKIVLPLALLCLTLAGCERDISSEAVVATFPTTAEIFIDAPVGLTDQFFRSFDPAVGANLNGFGVDNVTFYEGTASIRIDVPASNDPDGGFIGGIFEDRGEGRDLTGYDALTFWAKGSTSGDVLVGFGTDFDRLPSDPSYNVSTQIQMTTGWKKYVIPIPNPSRLVQESGMFLFSAGGFDPLGDGPNGNEVAWTFWIDELKFENLGTIGQSRPQIFNGQTVDFISVPGQTLAIDGLRHTVNLSNGSDVTTEFSPAYLDFDNTNSSVASVNPAGEITVLTTGTSEIRASLNGIQAAGLVNVQSFNDQRIISIFSDIFANVPVDNYNGFYEPFQTTLGGFTLEDGNGIIDYTDFNFVGIEFYGRDGSGVQPVDATEMTNFHIDIRPNEAISPTDFIRIELINNVGGSQNSGSITISGADLAAGEWRSFNIPLASFGLSAQDALGILLLVSDGTISTVSLDNIYFSKEVIEPTPNVNDTGATQAELPLGFESSTVTYNFTGFEGSVPAIEANPDQSGINPTATVMRMTKNVNAQFFAGTFLDLDTPIDFSSSTKIRMKVWSPKANIPVRFAVEFAGGGGQAFVQSNVPVANEWVELEFDFATAAGFNSANSYQRFIVFFEFIDGLPGDGSTYYYDDVKVLN
jgi:hypothetical protein